MVEFGVEITEAPTMAEISVFGDHEYVVAPLAVNVTDCPTLSDAELGETETLTAGETTAVTARRLALSIPATV
jgi:hypothetical protein